MNVDALVTFLSNNDALDYLFVVTTLFHYSLISIWHLHKGCDFSLIYCSLVVTMMSYYAMDYLIILFFDGSLFSMIKGLHKMAIISFLYCIPTMHHWWLHDLWHDVIGTYLQHWLHKLLTLLCPINAFTMFIYENLYKLPHCLRLFHSCINILK